MLLAEVCHLHTMRGQFGHHSSRPHEEHVNGDKQETREPPPVETQRLIPIARLSSAGESPSACGNWAAMLCPSSQEPALGINSGALLLNLASFGPTLSTCWIFLDGLMRCDF